ncbi:hypothetical protein ECZU12_55160 [Escherichia coli]|nr:hypothetical protein ECZU12_55160 [Escherichia coli]
MSVYTTAELLASTQHHFKFDPLFLRLFFRETYPFTTEKVYLSQIPGLVNMALYVSPIVSGEVIRSRGGSTSEFTPGYVKPKHEVNPQMTLRRLPDEEPQNLADPAYRRRRIIRQNMLDENLAIAQVEEMQAVSAVLKGKYTMTGEAFDPVEVDMGRSEANNITQSGGTEWSKRDKSTYDPTDDIEAYALNASGVVNIIVFDPKGWALFRSFKAVREKLDTRRGSHSELETAVKTGQSGVLQGDVWRCGHRRVFRTVRGKRRQKELPAGQHDGAGEHSGTRSAHLWLHSGCGRTARRH